MRRRLSRPKGWRALLGVAVIVLAAARADAGPVDKRSPGPRKGSFSGRDGVQLNSRSKEHPTTVPNECPEHMPYCSCEKKPRGLDVDCSRINSFKLKVVCDELRKEERHVRYFNIRNSDIPKLENQIFMGIKIEHLYIHDSNLKVLGSGSLSSQANILSHLVLSKNQLEEVPSQAIKTLHNLYHLNLNHNKITVLRNKAFNGLGKVTRLTLYDNQIARIDAAAFDGLTRDLLRLNLGKNYLERIPHEAILPLKYLKILELSENKISQMEADDFNGMDSLDQLTLNHNKLEHLGAGFFRGLHSLTTLYVDHNQIQTVNKDAFEGLEDSLTSLTLTGNQIQEFPMLALRRIHRLQTLHLDDNKITRLEEDAFEGFGEHIKFLWLQNNFIREILPPAFQDLHSLEWIKIANNDLKTLHYELMEPVLDSLMHIDLHSNPLICDCELRWYRQWIDEEWNEIDAKWLKETHCEDVSDKKQYNIAEVPLKDMFCDDGVKDKPPANKISDGGGAGSTFSSADLVLASLVAVITVNLTTFPRR